jgi:crotonobetainyl-CoA:carnitine CoA-transferase CaiB-like acyl-CoA transferase
MYLCGDPDRPPVRVTAEQAYAQAGIQGAVAALVAIWQRNESGKGAYLDLSTEEAMLWTLANAQEVDVRTSAAATASFIPAPTATSASSGAQRGTSRCITGSMMSTWTLA